MAEIAASIPGIKDIAAGTAPVDPIAEGRKAVETAEANLPTAYDIREADDRAAQARENRWQLGANYEAEMGPAREAYRLAAEKYAADEKALRPPMQRDIPEQPPVGLRPFLASSKDEGPELTISKLLQSVGLMATMIGGGRAGARASMSALTGAMEGWRDGAKYHADRQFKAWQNETEAMFRQWDNEIRAYNSVMIAERVPLEQKLRAMELRAREHHNDLLAADLEVREEDKARAALDKRIKAVSDARQGFAKLVEAKELGDKRIQERRETSAANIAARKAALEMHRQVAMVPTMSPQDIDTAAKNFLSSGGDRRWVPTFGLGHNADRGAFWSKVSQLTPEFGGAEGLSARKASMQGLQGELSQVMAVRGKAEAFAETARRNADMAVELSNKVDRTGSPMLDQWLLAGRKRWSGDEDVAKFDAATRSVINEITRVLNSATTAGVISDNARKEIESSLSIALSPEQFVGVVQMYKQEMANRSKSYADDIRRISLDIKNMASALSKGENPGAGGAQPAAPAAAPSGGWGKAERVN